MRFAVLSLALAACSGGTPEETDTNDTDTADTDTVDTSDTGDPGPRGTIEGTVTDESGAAIVGARVNFCRAQCVTAETDADGHYLLDVAAQTGSFYVREDSDLLDAIVALSVAEDEARAIDVTLYAADASVAIPATADAVEIAPGLHVTAGADTVEPALFEELGDTFSGASVAEDAMLPVEIDDPHGAFVAAYYLSPFEATSVDVAGLPYTIDNTFGLDAGTELVAFAASGPDHYTWLPAGDLTVSSDGATIEGGALPIFTTLVVFQAP